jgi:uncharacterized protein YjbI with pentapeptide repeats
LSHTTLRGGLFTGAALTNVTMDDAEMTEASFEGAALRGVSFERAILWGANFNRACLVDVQFVAADLITAMFADADGDRVNFASAGLADNLWTNAEFTNTRIDLPPELMPDVRPSGDHMSPTSHVDSDGDGQGCER